MATRLYLATTNNSGITPAFDGGWDTTSYGVRRDLYRAKSPLQGLAVTPGAGVTNDTLEIQYISPPLAAQTISGTVKCYTQPLDDRDIGDFLPYISIRVVSNDGATVRGTLLSLGTYGTGANYSGSSHRNIAVLNGDSLSSLAINDGDRLVVEIGHSSASADDDFAYFRTGCPTGTSDLAENETDTTTGVPWVEFSNTLNWQIKDDFNRSTLGTTNWEKTLGTNDWTIDSSVTARPGTAYTDTAMRYVGTFPDDQWAECDTEFTTGGDGAEGSVAVRMDGSGNCYFAQIGNNSITLFKRVSGSNTYLTDGSTTASANTLYRVRIEAIGTNIVAYLNDVFVCSANDSSLTSGNPGLFAHTGEFGLFPDFDNFASTDAASTGSTITPSGIASAEAFGSHTVAPGAVTISPSGIASAEAFGSHTVQSAPAQNIAPSGIASAEAFGTQKVNLKILPSGIASAEAFGSATVSNPAQSTRLYFPESTTAPVSPAFDSGWNYTSEALRRKWSNTKGSSAITVGTQIGPWTATAGQKALDRQYISDPLKAQLLTGTVKGQLMVREYANTDNVDRIVIALKVISSDGSTVRATLLSNAHYASTTEFINNATHRNAFIADGDSVTPYTCVDGDRLMIEIGYQNSTAGTTPEASAKWGENATDLPENETQTTDGAPWFQFSIKIHWQPQTVSPSGIAGGESFGTSKVNLKITPTGIASAEAFGSHTVQLGASVVSPTGIASAEAFGSHTIQPGAAAILPTGIASAEAFGTQKLNLRLSPSGITSAEAFGSHTVAPGAVTVSPTSIASAEAFGSHTVAPGAVTISPSGIASAEAFGASKLNLLLSASGMASAETFGSHSVLPGAVSISPSGIATAEAFGSSSLNLTILPSGGVSAEAFGSHTVQLGAASIQPTGVASAEAFGSAKLNLALAAGGIASAEAFGTHSVLPGAVSIQPTGIASDEVFGASKLNLAVMPSGIASAETFGSHTIQVGAVTISPTGIASAEQFGSAIIQAGVLFISPTGIASAEQFGSHSVLPGAVSISPAGIASTEAFGSALLNLLLSANGIASAEAFGSALLNLRLYPTGITSAEAFGTATVQRGTVTLSPSGIATDEAFGDALIQSGASFVAPAGIASAEAFGSATIQPGAVTVTVTGIASAEAFGSPALDLLLSPTGIASAEQFGNLTIQVGAATIQSAGIASAEQFGSPLLVAGGVLVSPTGIASTEQFGSAVVSPGTATITVSGMASAEAFGSTTIQPGGVTVTTTGIVSAEAFGNANVFEGAIVIIPSDRRTLLAKWRDARSIGTQWIHSVMMPGAFRHRLTLELGGSMNTALNQEIKDLVRGDDWVLERNYTGAPSGTNIIQATLTVKASAADADNAALAQVTITTSLSSDGQITANGSSGTVTLTIKVAHSQTVQATLRQYVYDVQLKHTSGDLVTVERGKIFPLTQITQATS